MHTDPYFFAGYDAEFGADQGHPGGVAAARETTEGRPQGESRSWEGRERLAVRQLRRRSRLGNLRIKRRGKARINTTLLKMLNGLIKPDAGSITMRGRVGALIALGLGLILF